MAENKTKKTQASVSAFIAGLKDPVARADSTTLVRMMEKATGAKAHMWGTLIGVRDVHIRSESGREVDWFAIGFAPRKGNISLYLSCGAVDPTAKKMLARLGPHKMGVGCLYIKRLADIDLDVLGALINAAAKANIACDVPPTPTAKKKSAAVAKTMSPKRSALSVTTASPRAKARPSVKRTSMR